MCSIFICYNSFISTKRSSKVMIDNRYSKELQEEILNDEGIQYDNECVQEAYLESFEEE